MKYRKQRSSVFEHKMVKINESLSFCKKKEPGMRTFEENHKNSNRLVFMHTHMTLTQI
jgi:hypothetical protein